MSMPPPPPEHHSPVRMYRDPRSGWVQGVCAGLADYLGVAPSLLRLAAVAGLLFFTIPTLLAYFVAAALLPRKPEQLYRDSTEERFWRDVRLDPSDAVHRQRQRFRELDRRLSALEAHVTSRRFKLDREIRDLGR